MAKDDERSLTPRLRFPEFREEPGWSEKPLKEICEINPPNSGLPDSFVYIDLESVEGGVLNARKRIERKNAPSRAQRALKDGDVVFQIVRPYQRNNLFVKFDDGETYVASTGYAQLRANESEAFLFQVIHTDPFVDKVIAKCSGSSYPAINSSDLADVLLLVPPGVREQKKIADCLTSLDEVIAGQGRNIEALKAHKKGLMQKLFPHEGETLPRLRFPEFRDKPEWRIDPIGELFETMTGGTPDRATKDYWGGSIPWITTSLVDFNVIDNAEEFISDAGLRNSSAKLFPKNTVLVALYGQGKTRGKVALLGIEATTNQACAAILPGDGIEPAFTFLSLCGRYDEMRGLSNSGGQENLSQGLLRELPFHFPKDMAEQQRIADCLSTLDTRIAAEADKLAALKAHKRGLMQQLFPSPERD